MVGLYWRALTVVKYCILVNFPRVKFLLFLWTRHGLQKCKACTQTTVDWENFVVKKVLAITFNDKINQVKIEAVKNFTAEKFLICGMLSGQWTSKGTMWF